MKKSVHPSTNNNILWDQNFNFHEFNKLLGPNDIVLSITPDDKPDAWYRIGQSFEEGWVEAPNMEIAMQWYKKAAAAHHHLAIERSNIRQ